MMRKETVIKVENISKQYRLGQVGTGTLSHDLKRWWALTRGKEDPYLKIGMENDRTQKATSEYAWAIKDVSFDVQKGDTLGIIGRNGAGKSTMLKLLSKVTAPSLGKMKIKGRIASLLEVGTGFHPELTGRENIYLNGAILGMTKKEIARKFDEIVQFAGVELYIDTPVKRYSSGMYVRLAFGVAAHLEPEILIVDEVLAVGDAEFQKKCLGKMNDVASDGRTIIFVSHNMQAVQSLCKTALYLKSGQVADFGHTDKVVANYLSREVKNRLQVSWSNSLEAPGNDIIKMISAEILPFNNDNSPIITVATHLDIRFRFTLLKPMEIQLSMHLNTSTGSCIFNTTTDSKELKVGDHEGVLRIPGRFLNDDIYIIDLFFVKETSSLVFTYKDLLTFEVADEVRTGNWFGKWYGIIRPKFDFSLT